ncbi:hypothetical protein PENARI_c014G04186 [Penicillium arizonense]|uniref:Uncharacterized protein n=1 Tax=Penicillium arizonense TaxID=1835702 RepID=A0A1F5LDN4_PENAI|nr:hypothetical protein PENARI_c014G04186 [Penicillium arizonense]OGE51265.1 hypothetical protein PENARI_c014G04186 [Penicillium arizonense]
MSYQPSIGSDLSRRRVSNAHVNPTSRRGVIQVNPADHSQVAEPADSGRHLRALERRAVTTENLSAGATTRGFLVVEPTDSGDQNIETLAQAFQGTTGTTAVADSNRELEGPTVPFQLASTWGFNHTALQCLKAEPDLANGCSLGHADQDDLWLECVVCGMINHHATTG